MTRYQHVVVHQLVDGQTGWDRLAIRRHHLGHLVAPQDILERHLAVAPRGGVLQYPADNEERQSSPPLAQEDKENPAENEEIPEAPADDGGDSRRFAQVVGTPPD